MLVSFVLGVQATRRLWRPICRVSAPRPAPDAAAVAPERLWTRAELRPHTILTQPAAG